MVERSSSVIILIFSHKPVLAPEERLSLVQCYRVLGSHPLRLVCPEGMSVRVYRELVPNLQVDFVPARWMRSLPAYNRLKMSSWLYQRYAQFEFMLTYELDALVFRDELRQWCERGWDYIGAPWFEGRRNAPPGSRLLGVGNSGFSLRRISTMLKVSSTFRQVNDLRTVWRNALGPPANRSRLRELMKGVLFNNFLYPLSPRVAEDYHWGVHAAEHFAGFRLAPLDEAVRFSFEMYPARLYELNGRNLPFGCHGWRRYEPEFWRHQFRAESWYTDLELPAAAS